jgi:hypothetical protein
MYRLFIASLLQLNFALGEASTAAYKEEQTHLQPIVVDCRPWRLAAGFQQQNRYKNLVT